MNGFDRWTQPSAGVAAACELERLAISETKRDRRDLDAASGILISAGISCMFWLAVGALLWPW